MAEEKTEAAGSPSARPTADLGSGSGRSPQSPRSDAAAAETVAAPTIEADTTAPEERADGDSALDVATQSSGTASLSSSILKYRVENGRTYHSYKEGSYFLPNDEVENERLDLQHHICVLMMSDKLHTAPIGANGKSVNRVLDAGCGTGIWAMDFADEHPEAHVIGVDLSPIQPNFVPPNVAFYVDDLEADWTYTQPFDYIYMRMLTGSIADWPKLMSQVYNNLTPGGYVELLDPAFPPACDDDSFPEDCALYKWAYYLKDGALRLGKELDAANKYKQQLIDAGFVNIVETHFKWPLNTWAKEPKYKELGAWVYMNVSDGLQGMSLAMLTRGLGWTPAEVEVFLAEVRKDLADKSMHVYWPIVAIYAQKPE